MVIKYSLSDLPAQMPDGDVQLILKANNQRWEDIDEDAAESIEGRAILQEIALSKYRWAEYRSGMS